MENESHLMTLACGHEFARQVQVPIEVQVVRPGQTLPCGIIMEQIVQHGAGMPGQIDFPASPSLNLVRGVTADSFHDQFAARGAEFFLEGG